jgi:K(+)-stimulated pyrophosphate-energized sodium pump
MNILIKLMSIVSLVIAPHLRHEVNTNQHIQKELQKIRQFIQLLLSRF